MSDVSFMCTPSVQSIAPAKPTSAQYVYM